MRVSDYTLDDFIVAFCDYDRDNYSHDGYQYLYNMLCEVSPDWDLDVIGVCCDYTEYDEDDLMDDYGYLGEDLDDVVRALQDRTLCAELSNGDYIVCAF